MWCEDGGGDMMLPATRLLSSTEYRDAWSLLWLYLRVSSILMQEKNYVKTCKCSLSATPLPFFLCLFKGTSTRLSPLSIKVSVIGQGEHCIVPEIYFCRQEHPFVFPYLFVMISPSYFRRGVFAYFVMSPSWYTHLELFNNEWLPSVCVVCHQSLPFLPNSLALSSKLGLWFSCLSFSLRAPTSVIFGQPFCTTYLDGPWLDLFSYVGVCWCQLVEDEYDIGLSFLVRLTTAPYLFGAM